mmetsp:Transcript_9035/g.12860  ORF Transcript_9035/g.12860 Transcript_9035/m.12860 type:complete len:168 (-) Transcript_9035:688-1191(-)
MTKNKNKIMFLVLKIVLRNSTAFMETIELPRQLPRIAPSRPGCLPSHKELHSFSMRKITNTNAMIPLRTSLISRKQFFIPTNNYLSMSKTDDNNVIPDEDDGWDSEKSDKIREIKSLTKKNVQENVNEPDLFIPIFSLVSLFGLFGAYGYEMLRLYSRGELYLPWDN